MESFVGSGSTEFESLLDGLIKYLETNPVYTSDCHSIETSNGITTRQTMDQYLAVRRVGIRASR